MTRIASGVDGVGIMVAVGGGISVGTTAGPATSVVDLLQAPDTTMINIAMMKCLARKGLLQKLRMAELYCVISRKRLGKKIIDIARLINLESKRDTFAAYLFDSITLN